MRIFHILNHTQKANGHVCAVVDLACTQAAQGYEVYVCSGGGYFDALLLENGVEHVVINQNRNIFTLVVALWKIHKAIRHIKPEIVHAHMVTSAVLVSILRPWMAFRLVTTVHNEFERSAILMGLGDRVIAVSDAVRQSMIRRGMPASKVKTVLNGTVDSPRHSKPPPAALKLQKPAIVFVGGLHPRKGVDHLIHAFGIVSVTYPNAHLYLVGEGPYRIEYEKLARNSGGTRISFCGYLDDPRPHLLGADIFVLSSLAEPAGLVLSEAREAGCAIIASNVDGVPEMLSNGAAGTLVPPKRPQILADAIIKLLADPVYLAEMRGKSQTNISHFSVKRVAAETEQVYRDLLAVR